MLAATQYTGAQAQIGFGRVYFPGPNRVGARAHFMRWAQPILRLSRRACARANDGLASVNAGQPLMKNLSHFVKSVLYLYNGVFKHARVVWPSGGPRNWHMGEWGGGH